MPDSFEMSVSPELLTVETAVETAPEEIRDEYAEFLENYNYQFGASSDLVNSECNLNYAFLALRYRLDGFETTEDASAALEDVFFETLAAAEGFTKTDTTIMGVNLYTREEELCDTAAIVGRVYVPRGRFVATVEAAIPTDRTYGVEAVIDQFAARLYELTLADVLRREVR